MLEMQCLVYFWPKKLTGFIRYAYLVVHCVEINRIMDAEVPFWQ